MAVLIYVAAVLVALWLVWDYRRNGRGSSLGYVYAIVGLCLAVAVAVRTLL